MAARAFWPGLFIAAASVPAVAQEPGQQEPAQPPAKPASDAEAAIDAEYGEIVRIHGEGRYAEVRDDSGAMLVAER